MRAVIIGAGIAGLAAALRLSQIGWDSLIIVRHHDHRDRPGRHGIRVTLTDGTVEQADLLIGADGLHSATRALLFGPERDFLLDMEHKVAVYMLDKRPAPPEPCPPAAGPPL